MVYLAHVFIKTNRQEEALKYFQMPFRVNPVATYAYLGLAAQLTTLGKRREALDMIEQAIQKTGITFELLQRTMTSHNLGIKWREPRVFFRQSKK